VVMVSQLGPAVDVRTTFRHEGDLLIRVETASSAGGTINCDVRGGV
jgi:hypothetical protein